MALLDTGVRDSWGIVSFHLKKAFPKSSEYADPSGHEQPNQCDNDASLIVDVRNDRSQQQGGDRS
ncbi:MAG: hypothetical protein ACYSU0_12475 [Planctomycetota bacterium]